MTESKTEPQPKLKFSFRASGKMTCGNKFRCDGVAFGVDAIEATNNAVKIVEATFSQAPDRVTVHQLKKQK